MTSPSTAGTKCLPESKPDRYRCDNCGLEQDDSAGFHDVCPQCDIVDQFYLVDKSED